MNTIRLTEKDNHQYLEIPAEYKFASPEVFIKKIGNTLVLIPKENPWQTFFDSLAEFSDDFMETREQPPQQNREDLFA